MDDSYLAGLFDGEGCVAVRWYNRKYTTTAISVSVSMTDETPVRLFAERFGGGYKVGARLTRSGRTVYKWEQTGTTSEAALKVLSRLCLVKKPQIDLTLQVIELLKANKGRFKISSEENAKRKSIATQIQYLKRVSG